jgi:hypothetical protein
MAENVIERIKSAEKAAEDKKEALIKAQAAEIAQSREQAQAEIYSAQTEALKYISSEREKIKTETIVAQENAKKKAEEESEVICSKAQQNLDKAVEAVLEGIR